MTCYHIKRNTTDELVPCASDPCGRHSKEIRADSIEEAYAIFDRKSGRSTGMSGGGARTTGGHAPIVRIRTLDGGTVTRHEFESAAGGIADSITESDWSLMNRMSARFANAIRREGAKAAREHITDFLKSDSDDADAARRMLGRGTDYDEFAALVTSNVKSMTLKAGMGSPISRVLLTRTSNDMTKRRYIASVLFFGGRCCYCGRPLHTGFVKIGQKTPEDAATGEHLDPVAGHPHGETKFGNMALACNRCNMDKGDEPLNRWLDTNRILTKTQKKEARRRISEFRTYTLYEPMSEEKSDAVDRETIRLERRRRSIWDGVGGKANASARDSKLALLDIKSEVNDALDRLNDDVGEDEERAYRREHRRENDRGHRGGRGGDGVASAEAERGRGGPERRADGRRSAGGHGDNAGNPAHTMRRRRVDIERL